MRVHAEFIGSVKSVTVCKHRSNCPKVKSLFAAGPGFQPSGSNAAPPFLRHSTCNARSMNCTRCVRIAESATTSVAPAARAAVLQCFLRVIRKSNHRHMRRDGVAPQLFDEGANIRPGRNQVGENQHRPGAPGAGHQLARIGYRLDAILQVLQPVDQLAARHQVFVKHNRQWQGHVASLNRRPGNCKRIPADCRRDEFNRRKFKGRICQ